MEEEAPLFSVSENAMEQKKNNVADVFDWHHWSKNSDKFLHKEVGRLSSILQFVWTPNHHGHGARVCTVHREDSSSGRSFRFVAVSVSERSEVG